MQQRMGLILQKKTLIDNKCFCANILFMSKYYKVISWISLFREAYNIEEIYDIAPGSRFVAKKSEESAYVMLKSKQPVLHFAKGPLNTLLWYDIFDDEQEDAFLLDTPPIQIYEIQPIGPISHGVCNDDYRLNQYGAHAIEFKERVPVSKIIEQAIAVYDRTNPKIYNKYQANDIKSWQSYVHNPELWKGYIETEKRLEEALRHKR